MTIEKINRKLMYAAFSLYLIILVWVILMKFSSKPEILGSDYIDNPLGFGYWMGKYMELDLKGRFLYDFTDRIYDFPHMIKDFPMNIVLFIPFGIYMSLIFKKPEIVKITLLGFGLSLFFELYQLFTAFGAFSFTDLLFNTLGSLLGVLIYMLLIKLISKNIVGKVVDIINIVVIFIIVPVIIYAIVMTVINIDCFILRYSSITY